MRKLGICIGLAFLFFAATFPRVQASIFSDDSRYVAEFTDHSYIAIWNVGSGKLIGGVQVTKDLKRFVIDTSEAQPKIRLEREDGEIAVSDINGQKDVQWLKIGKRKPYRQALNGLKYGWQVQQGDDDRTLYLVNIDTNKEYPIHLPNPIDDRGHYITVSANGQDLVLYTKMPLPKWKGYSIWKSHRDRDEFKRFTPFGRSWIFENPVLISKDASCIVVWEPRPEPAVRIWNKDLRHSSTIDCIQEFPPSTNFYLTDLALSDDGKLFAFSAKDFRINIYSTSTKKLLESLDAIEPLKAARLEIPKQETEQGRIIYQSSNIGSISISPDNNLLYAWLNNNMILWNRSTGKAIILEQPVHEAPH